MRRCRVADIQAQTRLKGSRGQQVVDLTLQLLGLRFIGMQPIGWMYARCRSSRASGPVPTNTCDRLPEDIALAAGSRDQTAGALCNRPPYNFLKSTPATVFIPQVRPCRRPRINVVDFTFAEK